MPHLKSVKSERWGASYIYIYIYVYTYIFIHYIFGQGSELQETLLVSHTRLTNVPSFAKVQSPIIFLLDKHLYRPFYLVVPQAI